MVADEHEKGERKLLNFGHTAAHAIENLYDLPHGQAVAIGMVIAATLSEIFSGLPHIATKQLKAMLAQYGLPVSYKIKYTRGYRVTEDGQEAPQQCYRFYIAGGNWQGFNFTHYHSTP